MLKLGPVELGAKPAVIAVVADAKDVSQLPAAMLDAIDVFEVRADMFRDCTVSSLRHVLDLCRARGKGVLLTVRSRDEGGRREMTDTERLERYLYLLDNCDAVDIEVASASLWPHMRKVCKRAGKLLIGSFHDFDGTPEDAALEAMFKKCRKQGGDIFKTACMAHTREELGRLLCFTLAHNNDNIITLSMGQAGLVSRVAAPALGSLATYGYLSQSSAPGQLSCAELVKYLKVFAAR
jgi:3-dehydroquinate dehydratase-1